MSDAPLSLQLPGATRELHAQAERAGVMRSLLAGRLERGTYVRLLGSLHVIYHALESALAGEPVRKIAPMPALDRTQALARDLADYGSDPRSAQPVQDALDYAAHLEQLARDNPVLIAAHAYVRYLGDLSGGQVLRNIVERGLAPGPGHGVAFYAFGSKEDVDRAKTSIRAALDALPRESHAAIVAEARSAFARHIGLFESLA